MREILLKLVFVVVCFSPWWVTIIIVNLTKEDKEDIGW